MKMLINCRIEILLLLLITLINCELLKIDIDYGNIRNATCVCHGHLLEFLKAF